MSISSEYTKRWKIYRDWNDRHMECIELIHNSDNDRENTFAFDWKKKNEEWRQIIVILFDES